MSISERELTDRVYKLSIYYRDVSDEVQTFETRLYATSKLGAMRRATNFVNDWVKKNAAVYFVCGVYLSAELGSWSVHRLYDNGVAFTPWIDKLPVPSVDD